MAQIILNFHGVGPVPRTLDAGEHNCWLDQTQFEAVLDMAIGQSHVQLTFDDGNASDFALGLPALQQRKLQATFFVCAGRLDQPHFLSQSQLQGITNQGMNIGSHGINHVAWRHLPLACLREEIEGSRRILEQVCGRSVDSAACPFGSYDRHVLAALRQAGYRRVYTSDKGNSSVVHWLQARTTVTRSMPISYIERMIRQGPNALEQSLIDVRKIFKRLRW